MAMLTTALQSPLCLQNLSTPISPAPGVTKSYPVLVATAASSSCGAPPSHFVNTPASRRRVSYIVRRQARSRFAHRISTATTTEILPNAIPLKQIAASCQVSESQNITPLPQHLLHVCTCNLHSIHFYFLISSGVQSYS